jgi:hypothetical protein
VDGCSSGRSFAGTGVFSGSTWWIRLGLPTFTWLSFVWLREFNVDAPARG